jgi:cell wall-associated NlpC family hydrolase/enamine deaminase RidA (YjgF/YER057c/UK114 family)
MARNEENYNDSVLGYLAKILESSLDSKSTQEIIQKIQENSASSIKSNNQDIIKGLSELSNLSSENVSYAEKLNSMTAEIQKDNAQARLQDMLKDTKRFRLESKYWKDLTGGIKGMAAEFHDFRNNPSRWMSEAMGDLLGKTMDRAVSGIANSISALGKSMTDALKGLGDSFFQAIDDARQQTEAVARETGYSYEDAQKTVDQINVIGLSLVKQGKANGQFLLENSQAISQKMVKNFGKDWMEKFEPEKQTEMLTVLGAALRQNVDIDKAFTTFGGDFDKLYDYLTNQVNLEGAMRKLDQKQEATVKALMMDINDQQYGLTHEEIIAMNKENAIWGAEMAKKNEYFNEQVASELKGVFTEVAQMRDIQSHISEENIHSLQTMGIATKDLEKTMRTGSFEQKTAIVKALAESSKAGDLTPALQQLALRDSKTLDFLTSVKYERNEDVREKMGEDYINDKNSYMSPKKIMEMERDAFFKAMVAMRQQVDESEINNEVALSWGLERVLKTEKELKDVDFSKIGVNEITKMSEMVSGSAEEQAEFTKTLTAEQQKVFEFMLKKGDDEKTVVDRAKELVKDTAVVAEQATLMSELGFDKALASGGLNGLLGSVIETTMGSAFSNEQAEKLKKFLGGIGNTLKPVFNVLKSVIIDPIIDAIQDVIGNLLGEILVAIKSWWKEDDYSEEERIMDRYKFLSTGSNNVEADKEKIDEGNYSEAYRDAVKNIDSKTISDIENIKGLSEKEKIKLQVYKAENSEVMNTDGKIMGTDEITNLDYTDKATSKNIQKLLQKSSITVFKNGKGEYKSTLGGDSINDLVTLINESDDSTGKTGAKFLGMDPDVNESDIFKLAKALLNKGFGGKVSDFYKLFGVDKSTVWNPMDMLVLGSYFLLKENLDIGAKKYSGNHNLYNYQLLDHNDESDYHIVINGKPVEYANGGVVAATKGGQRITVGEAGYDEIIIPTDPAKQQRAQELLKLAQDKYGLYAKDPNNIDAKLKQQMADLLLDLRVLMIQLDPMRDVIAMQSVMQAFSMLKNASVIANPDAATDVQEELIGEGMPTLGEPIKDAANLGAIRNKIVEEAKKYIGTRYAEAPAGLVCNELINAAYAGVLGKENYAEMLRTLGYAHDEMHTISGFIPEIRRGSGDKVLLASSVEYSALSSLAKPGDLVFSANTGKVKNGLNPDNHGHVNLFIDKDSKIDSTSVNNAGVGIHKPGKGAHMLMNLLDNMPESWYVSKGLLKSNAVGIEDASTMTSHYYDPALQSTPNASYVSDQVSRADQAKIEKERRTAERQNKAAMEQVTEVLNNIGIKLTGMDMKRQMSVNIPQDKTFRTSGMNSSSVINYSQG